MQVQAFSLLGQGALDAVQAALAQALAGWAAQWGVAPARFALRAERPDESGAARAGWSCVRWQGRAAWLSLPDELAGEVQRTLYPPDAIAGPQDQEAPRLAPAAARAAFDALALALARAAVGEGAGAAPGADEEIAEAWRRGSGAVLVMIGAGRVLLDAACVRALCASSPAYRPPAPLAALAPVDLAAAVAPQPVALQLAVGGARLALGSLLSLEPGDVIRLDSSADAALTLAAAGGAPVLKAYLGRVGADIAVEIAGPN